MLDFSVKMRYFPNPFQDFLPGTPFQPNEQVWLTKARQVANLIFSNQRHAEGNTDGGLYVGPSGIAYALWKLSTFLESSEAKPILDYAEKLVNVNLSHVQNQDPRDKKNKFGFLLGGSGVYAVGAMISHSLGKHSERDRHLQFFCEIAEKQELTPTVVHRCGSDELL